VKLLAYILASITLAIMFATYIGNYALDTAFYNLGRTYTMGCGLGIVKARDFSYQLTAEEIAFCVNAGLEMESAFKQIPVDEF